MTNDGYRGFRRLRELIPALLIAILFLPAVSQAQERVRVEEIRSNPRAHVNETRQIEGIVARFVDMGATTTSAYFVEDDFGHQLRVLTTDSPPARGARVRVRGVVTVEGSGDPYLLERETVVLSSAAPRPVAPTPPVPVSPTPRPLPPPPPAAIPPASSDLGVDPALLAFGAGFLVLSGVLLFLLLRGRKEPVAAHMGSDTSVGMASPPQPTGQPSPLRGAMAGSDASNAPFDGRTVKFTPPPPGTVKLLPGRLEIIFGDDKGRDIRFMQQGGGLAQVTFGRNPGPDYKHIQLKAPTVSREHARMSLSGSSWTIENLSSTNPVRVNGNSISSEGQMLSVGDEIDMGEVKFRFQNP